MKRIELIRAVRILADGLNDGEEEVIGRLIGAGFDAGAATRLVAFVPSAFARPVLEEMGVIVSNNMGAITTEGREIDIQLDQQPEYIAALRLAREHRQHGALDHEDYTKITGGSSEIDAVSNACNAGADIRGATIASALVWPIDARFLITLPE